MKKIIEYLPVMLIFIAFVVLLLTVYVGVDRDLTNLEVLLLQIFSLVSGITGSYLIGKQSTKDAAKEIVKPHARSAFRRLMSLYESLSRVGGHIGEYRSQADDVNGERAKVTLEKLEVIVVEQLATADDALEDWNDIVPEEVKEIRERLTSPDTVGKDNE